MEESLELASRGSIIAQIHDSFKMGCKCKSAHCAKYPPDGLEDLMISIQDMDKQRHLKYYVLGALAVIAKEATSRSCAAASESIGSRTYTFAYTAVGWLVCCGVFLEMHDMKVEAT